MGVNTFIKTLAEERTAWPTDTVQLSAKYGKVRIQALSVADRDYFILNSALFNAGKPEHAKGFQVEMLKEAIIDEKGNLLFNDSNKKLLGYIDKDDMEKLINSVTKLSGMQAGAVEEATEDLKGDPLPDSGTNSPKQSEEDQSPD